MEHLGKGTLIVAGAAVVNGALGVYLVRQGKKHHSLILEANGGRWAVRLGAQPVTLEIEGAARRVFLFGSHQGIAYH